jgi:hypothetical protein
LSSTQEQSLLALTGFGAKSFSLLWRGSRDGFEAFKFHELCNGKPDTLTLTLTLIKSTTGYIFGGYTSVPWSNQTCFKADITAFLFTLTNPNYIPLKLKVTAQNAVYHCVSYGPCFGSSSKDLFINCSSNNDTSNSIRFNAYQFPNGKSGDEGGKFFLGDSIFFQSAEIEVFQVI